MSDTNQETQVASNSELEHETPAVLVSSDPAEGEIVRGEKDVPSSAEQAPKADQAAPAAAYFLVKRQNIATPVLDIKSDKPFNGSEEVIALPPTLGPAIDATIRNLDNLNLSAETNWISALSAAQPTLYDPKEVTPSLSRAGSMWTQQPNVDGGQPLRGSQLLVGTEQGQNLSGDRAVLAALSHFDMGTIFQTPLWHSGFWIRLRARSNSDIMEFVRRYTQEKITLGRSTYGTAFSNHMVYTMEAFMELIESSYYNSSLPERPTDIASLVSIHDFMSLVWGLACATYPSGFNYRRSCIHAPGKCNHVVEERVSVPRLFWVDRNALTDEQVRHMRRDRKASMTLEQIQQYQSDLAARFHRVREIKDSSGKSGIVEFQIPTVRQAIEAGSVWVNNISRSVLEALGADSTVNGRNEYMNDVARATSARQHLHWVKSFTFNGAVVDKREALEKLFDNVISASDELLKQFSDHVLDFSNDTLIAVLGVPNYTCPACGGHQHVVEGEDGQPLDENADIPTIVPIEGVTTFFELLFQKVQLIRARD